MDIDVLQQGSVKWLRMELKEPSHSGKYRNERDQLRTKKLEEDVQC